MLSLQDILPLLPESGMRCLVGAVMHSKCGTNVTCVCEDANLNAQATSCILANSTVREALTTQNLTNALCGIESVPDYSYEKIMIPFMTLACVAVILRLFARFSQETKFWWDDACNIVALTCCVTYTAISLKMKHFGVGLDIWAVPQENISSLIKHYYVCFVMYGTSRAFIRLSIVLFFMRIFRLTYARPVMIFTFALINGVSLAFVLTLIFQCTPVRDFWLRWDGEHQGTCINLAVFMRASALISIVVDFWQLLVAIPFIVRLTLSFKKKLLIVVMLSTGIAVIILSIVRYPTIQRFTGSRNFTRDIISVGVWSALELDIGLICACLPSIQVIFKSCGTRKPNTTAGRYVEMSKSTKKTGFSSGKGSSDSRSIVIHTGKTIEIQQQTIESERDFPLDPAFPRSSDVELTDKAHGYVTSQAWAK